MTLPILSEDYRAHVAEAGNELVHACFGQAHAMGWHEEFAAIDAIEGIDDKLRNKLKGHFIATKLMLGVSELAEGMEGARKGLMDTHLPQHPMLAVELADCVIRVFDLAGLLQFDLGDIIAEKLAYNATRADHQLANRAAEGGKSY